MLERDEFASFWALKWADIMRGNREAITERGVHNFHRYLVRQFATDRPFDQFAREILTSRGNSIHSPSANFYRIAHTPEDAAESAAQLFLGVRIQCAKCHNHPYEAMTQKDYYGLAAFFARVQLKGQRFGLDDEVVLLADEGEVTDPIRHTVQPPYAFGKPFEIVDREQDRRRYLADWLIAADNPYFARAIANRVWAHLMGRGIVEPVDDFRESNPPSNSDLLDALATAFVRGGYRVKPLIRQIMNSATYQLSATAGPVCLTLRGRPGALLHVGRGEDSHGRTDPRCDLFGDRCPGAVSGLSARHPRHRDCRRRGPQPVPEGVHQAGAE